MNKNRGFIGIGLILAIVLGIVVVGGGAYYLGKSGSKQEVKNPADYLPNNENKNLPVVDNNQPGKVTSGCMLPSITVLNPNEKETYTLGQIIDIKWASNCIDSNKKISIGVNKVVPNQDQAVEDMHRVETTNSGSYKWLVSKDTPTGQYEVYVTYTLENGYESVFGRSLNLITINSSIVSASQKCIDTATSLLPAYIFRQGQGDYSDFKLNKVNFFALRSDASGAQYFTGNPTNDACMVNVSYSVKLKAGVMNAGNGQESTDGWIINKSGYATVDKNSSGYYISSMGTGY